MKKLIVLSLLALSALCLTACNTINGIGKDVEKVGEKMQDASKK